MSFCMRVYVVQCHQMSHGEGRGLKSAKKCHLFFKWRVIQRSMSKFQKITMIAAFTLANYLLLGFELCTKLVSIGFFLLITSFWWQKPKQRYLYYPWLQYFLGYLQDVTTASNNEYALYLLSREIHPLKGETKGLLSCSSVLKVFHRTA